MQDPISLFSEDDCHWYGTAMLNQPNHDVVSKYVTKQNSLVSYSCDPTCKNTCQK